MIGCAQRKGSDMARKANKCVMTVQVSTGVRFGCLAEDENDLDCKFRDPSGEDGEGPCCHWVQRKDGSFTCKNVTAQEDIVNTL